MIAMARTLRAFVSCRRGNFGIIFALAAVPVLGIAGLALDYSRISSAKDRLQLSVDSAIVAAAASGAEVAQMQAIVADFVEVNFGEAGVEVETTVNSYDMRVEATYALDLALLSAIGKPQAQIVAQAELQSEAPLRGGSVATPSAGLDKKQLERVRKMLKRLPPEMRRKLEAGIDAAIAEAGRNDSGRYYIYR